MALGTGCGVKPMLLVLAVLLVLLPAQVHAFGAGSMYRPPSGCLQQYGLDALMPFRYRLDLRS